MEPRSISDIAEEIDSLIKPEKLPHALPYLHAMRYLNTVKDNYGADSGKSIVMYFLSNVQTWRGDDARRIKAELKELIK